MIKKLLFAFAFLISCMAVQASTVKILVPYAPGGIGDLTAKTIAAHLNERVPGHNFIPEFHPGAGGAIAAQHLAASTGSDTVLMIHSINVVVNSLNPDAKYTLQQFQPVVFLGSVPMFLCVKTDGPVSTFSKFLNNKNTIFYGSSGIGSGNSIAMAMLQSITGKDMVHVPYKGESPAMIDVAGGQITALFSSIATAQPLIDSGKVAALAVTGNRRHPQLPQVPTFQEQGVRGLAAPINWIVVFANNSADPALVSKVNTALTNAIKANPEAYARVGLDTSYTLSGDVKQFISQEHTKMQKLLPTLNNTKQ